MTIYGTQYRPAPYAPTSAWTRLLPIVRLEFTSLFRSRWGIVAFCLCLFPSVIRLVMLLIWVGVLSFGGPIRRMQGNAPRELQELMPDSARFYVEPIVAPEHGFMVFVLLTTLVTARAIAKDRSTNALEFYWTRGISPLGYFGAKWLGSFLLVSTMTVAAPVVLWVVGSLLSDDWTFLHDTAGFMPGAVAGLLVFTASLTGICILLSAIAGSPNVAMILWCLLLGGSLALGQVVQGMSGRVGIGTACSLFEAAGALARALAGIPQRGVSVGGAAALLLGSGAVLAALARRRLRLQEAVG
jgi:ABC-type transport system involved in multi-copper enzyme maturation permease subunit